MQQDVILSLAGLMGGKVIAIGRPAGGSDVYAQPRPAMHGFEAADRLKLFLISAIQPST